MNYNIIYPFDLSIDEVFTSEPLANGLYIELNLTEEDGEINLYRWDSKSQREDCICATGLLPILKDLVSWARCYSCLEKDELAEVYERALGYIVSKIFAQELLSRLMKEYEVDSTIDLIEILLNLGKLDWLLGL